MATIVHSPLAPGDIVGGDFRILGKLAEGGMGLVFRAEQLSTRKLRALKVMHPALIGDAAMRGRFLQEARVVAELDSDHAVDVVAAGVDDESGAMWLAMELLRGQTLDAYVHERGTLSASALRELGVQLRHVLAQAHGLGLVHRDLKPENIFMCTPRRAGVSFTAKVLDFGIAKFLQEARGPENSQAMGSPLWMAPEQWRQSALITPAVDVWALALVMFYAVSGHTYWRSASLQDVAQVAVEVVTGPIVPPTERARELGVEVVVAPGFDDWFRRCVARDPAHRFANANRALAAFDALFVPESGRDGPDTVPELAETVLQTGSSLLGATTPDPAGAGTPPTLSQIWPILAEPLERQRDVARVIAAIGPVLAEQAAVDASLAGLSSQWRIDRVSAQIAIAGNPGVAAAKSALRSAADKLGLTAPAAYFLSDQREPLRVESTLPLSLVLGASLADLQPATIEFLSAVTVAVQRNELVARAYVDDPAGLHRTIAAAVEIAHGRAPRRAGAMLLSSLRAALAARPDVLVCLEEHGSACSESAVAEWFTAVDATLARVGVTSAPVPVALLEALDHWPLRGMLARQSIQKAATAWAADPSFNAALAAWRAA